MSVLGPQTASAHSLRSPQAQTSRPGDESSSTESQILTRYRPPESTHVGDDLALQDARSVRNGPTAPHSLAP